MTNYWEFPCELCGGEVADSCRNCEEELVCGKCEPLCPACDDARRAALDEECEWCGQVTEGCTCDEGPDPMTLSKAYREASMRPPPGWRTTEEN